MINNRFFPIAALLHLLVFCNLDMYADVTFHVEDLAKMESMFFKQSCGAVAGNMVRQYSYYKNVPGNREDDGIVYVNFQTDSIASYDNNSFAKGMMNAFANHWPVVLSPDVIWLLISQSFADYVNKYPKKVGKLIVDYDGMMKLTALTSQDLMQESSLQLWEEVLDQFTKQIADNTKNGLAQVLDASFSTTGPTERLVSRMTLMSAVKPYFNYEVIYLVCGIPDITLTGTSDDWRQVRQKAASLRGYGIDWWIDELDPILEQFIKASEGQADTGFWQDMVMKKRPGQIRYASCDGSETSEFDGWFLKFYPYDQKGRTPSQVKYNHPLRPEIVCVPFKYKVINPELDLEMEYDLELWGGIVGVLQNPKDESITPQIGWMLRRADK